MALAEGDDFDDTLVGPLLVDTNIHRLLWQLVGLKKALCSDILPQPTVSMVKLLVRSVPRDILPSGPSAHLRRRSRFPTQATMFRRRPDSSDGAKKWQPLVPGIFLCWQSFFCTGFCVCRAARSSARANTIRHESLPLSILPMNSPKCSRTQSCEMRTSFSKRGHERSSLMKTTPCSSEEINRAVGPHVSEASTSNEGMFLRICSFSHG